MDIESIASIEELERKIAAWMLANGVDFHDHHVVGPYQSDAAFLE